MKTVYEDVCVIHNTDRDKEFDAEILTFSPGKILVVSLERSLKITMPYQERVDIYVGSVHGMEFTSKGPDSRTVHY
jgi:hypothetical protein